MTQAKHFDGTGALVLEADYTYDAWGNRTTKTIYLNGSSTASTSLRFLYDGWNPSKAGATGNSAFDVWADVNIIIPATPTLDTRYLRGDQVDQVFARTDSTGAAFWNVADQQGSTRTIIDNVTGAIQDTLTYDGFGKILTESAPSLRGRYAWTGREIDAETNLQYNRARYFDPATGRWISQDPLGFDAGDSNLYRYVKNSPTGNREYIASVLGYPERPTPVTQAMPDPVPDIYFGAGVLDDAY